MRKRIDATQGSLVKLIFTFAIPLVFTTLMQHAFNIADKAVLGQLADATAVASVGVTGFVTALIINGFVGLATGAGIILARFVGQKDEEKIKSTIETSLIISFVFGVIVAIVGVILAPQLLGLINCPEECYDGALLYFRLYIAASPARSRTLIDRNATSPPPTLMQLSFTKPIPARSWKAARSLKA